MGIRSVVSGPVWAALSLGLALAIVVGAHAADDARERFDTVVIDAGHGGPDTGAKGPAGSLEKDVALAVARNLAAKLRKAGLTVVMTRDADVRVPLEERTAIANDARGDLFVSIHANAAEQASIRGSETYFLALEASGADAEGVAERENRAFAEEAAAIEALSDPFIALLGDLIATEHLDESSHFARSVQGQLATEVPIKSRGVKQAMFVVLSGVQMPAALVEIGFVTHAGDERVITGTRGRAAIVAALEKAVLSFGERYDARRDVAPASTPAAP